MGNEDKPRLILASSSPQRRQLLTEAGYDVHVVAPLGDETLPEGEEDPHRIATALALRKARSVWLNEKEGLILAADTLTVLGGGIIGKPNDPEDARRILRKVSGTRHSVITAVVLINAASGDVVCASKETAVKLKTMTDAEINDYVASGEAMGASGAYRIQEKGDRFIEEIEGSVSNVIGLPVELVEDLIKRLS